MSTNEKSNMTPETTEKWKQIFIRNKNKIIFATAIPISTEEVTILNLISLFG